MTTEKPKVVCWCGTELKEKVESARQGNIIIRILYKTCPSCNKIVSMQQVIST